MTIEAAQDRLPPGAVQEYIRDCNRNILDYCGLLGPHLRFGETPTMVFPVSIRHAGKPHPALVLFYPDRLMVAWSTGLRKSKRFVDVIRHGSIKEMELATTSFEQTTDLRVVRLREPARSWEFWVWGAKTEAVLIEAFAAVVGPNQRVGLGTIAPTPAPTSPSSAGGPNTGPGLGAARDDFGPDGEQKVPGFNSASDHGDAAREPRTEEGGEGFRVRVSVGQPFEGVCINAMQVTTGSSQVTMTSADGNGELVLPERGSYEVTVITRTLPAGMELRDPELVSVTLEVEEGRPRSVVFPLRRSTPR
jgi:hypothetical protein